MKFLSTAGLTRKPATNKPTEWFPPLRKKRSILYYWYGDGGLVRTTTTICSLSLLEIGY